MSKRIDITHEPVFILGFGFPPIHNIPMVVVGMGSRLGGEKMADIGQESRGLRGVGIRQDMTLNLGG
jgi:hypothetical protein